jgi:hypothetical protein
MVTVIKGPEVEAEVEVTTKVIKVEDTEIITEDMTIEGTMIHILIG